MNNLKVEDIIKICNGMLLTKAKKSIEITDFSRDTRSIKKGEFYIALKGESINGNDYVEDALEKGAIGSLVDEEIDDKIIKKYNDRVIIRVENTLVSIQQIARYKREMYDIPVIAITGSVRENKYKGRYCKCSI